MSVPPSPSYRPDTKFSDKKAWHCRSYKRGPGSCWGHVKFSYTNWGKAIDPNHDDSIYFFYCRGHQHFRKYKSEPKRARAL